MNFFQRIVRTCFDIRGRGHFEARVLDRGVKIHLPPWWWADLRARIRNRVDRTGLGEKTFDRLHEVGQ